MNMNVGYWIYNNDVPCAGSQKVVGKRGKFNIVNKKKCKGM